MSSSLLNESRPPMPTTEQILDAMRRAAAEELERKRRLGHYTVSWEDGRVVLRGEDAPAAVDSGLTVAETPAVYRAAPGRAIDSA